ncbi:MAG: S41 family peptidase [Cellvibrio sp.]|uniref:S41 family peptidase n=1 Tax=Cellvibrio sp. TaxID=1965322 RepID=UPI0031B342E8
MHPAILESDATEFHRWHKEGYEQAKKLLPLVHSEIDAGAVLRFYMAGYQDSHINGYLDHTPYSKIDLPERKWTGWLLKATNTGYVVVYRKDGKNYPPENARLLSCDGQQIDNILKTHYAPYFDLRWQVLDARDTAAKAFTQNRSNTGVLNRPEFQNCDFMVNDQSVTYPIQWMPISEVESIAIKAKSHSEYKLPQLFKLAPDILWVRASDFALYTSEAVQSQKKLVEELASSKGKALIILDTRGNGGGSSVHGTDIFHALFENDEKAGKYLANKYQYQFQGSNALFRASWQLYWSYEVALKETIATQGKESVVVKHLERFLERLKNALDSGEKTLFQNEFADENNTTTEPSEKWESTIKLVLITDKSCVSACLDFVDIVKLVPNLLHLGEPTDADTAYTQIAYMQSEYLKETYNFMVPVKKWNNRMREDNKPYIPDVIYEGDMNDDKALEKWVLEQANQHFSKML